jgi:hypothetical protein
MAESRTDLLQWINDLLHTSPPYTKIEQTGTGAAHAQIVDSIFGDVPLSKIKFETRQEYEYLQNFKVVQSAMAAHNIDKVNEKHTTHCSASKENGKFQIREKIVGKERVNFQSGRWRAGTFFSRNMKCERGDTAMDRISLINGRNIGSSTDIDGDVR